MPSIFDDWLEYSAEQCKVLHEALSAYCEGRPAKTTIDNYARVKGLTNLRKWLRQNTGREGLSEENFHRLVVLGMRDGWLGADSSSFYDSFADWLGAARTSATNLVRHFEVWRYSYLAPGYVLRGSMKISYQKDQVITEELYKIQSEVAREFSLGADDIPFPRTGLFFARGTESHLLVSKRADHESELQTAFLEEYANGLILRGPFSDWHGNDFYAGRMWASPTPKNLPLAAEHVKAVQPKDVSDTINDYLTKDLVFRKPGADPKKIYGIVSGF